MIRAGSIVIVHLVNPNEKLWGLLQEIGVAGVFLRGINVVTFDDWMVQAWEATFNQTSFDRDQKGRVASVKPDGDGVVVSFKTESWKEPVFKCRETNKVHRITADGRLEYRQHCVAAGTETVKVTPRPVWIRKDLAAGITKGVFMKWRVDSKPSPAQGFPLEVYADQAQTKLLSFHGFPIKK